MEVKDKIISIFDGLNQSNISYRLAKNIFGELPLKYIPKKNDIDIIVHPKESKHLSKVMISFGFFEWLHPFVREGMIKHSTTSPRIYRNDQGIILDIYFGIGCKNIDHKSFMYFDGEIQNRIWESYIFDLATHAKILGDKERLFYLICRTMFDKNDFDRKYSKSILKLLSIVGVRETESMLFDVFGSFAKPLCSMIIDYKFDCIISEYHRW